MDNVEATSSLISNNSASQQKYVKIAQRAVSYTRKLPILQEAQNCLPNTINF